MTRWSGGIITSHERWASHTLTNLCALTHKRTHSTHVCHACVHMCLLNGNHLTVDSLCRRRRRRCLNTIHSYNTIVIHSLFAYLPACLALHPVFSYGATASDICLSAKTNKSAKLLLQMIAHPKHWFIAALRAARPPLATPYLADLMTLAVAVLPSMLPHFEQQQAIIFVRVLLTNTNTHTHQQREFTTQLNSCADWQLN